MKKLTARQVAALSPEVRERYEKKLKKVTRNRRILTGIIAVVAVAAHYLPAFGGIVSLPSSFFFCRFLIVGECASEMWRLVVGYVLPRHSHSIHMVVHECWYAVFRGCVGGEYIKV